jgi:hypothetical protein
MIQSLASALTVQKTTGDPFLGDDVLPAKLPLAACSADGRYAGLSKPSLISVYLAVYGP